MEIFLKATHSSQERHQFGIAVVQLAQVGRADLVGMGACRHLAFARVAIESTPAGARQQPSK